MPAMLLLLQLSDTQRGRGASAAEGDGSVGSDRHRGEEEATTSFSTKEGISRPLDKAAQPRDASEQAKEGVAASQGDSARAGQSGDSSAAIASVEAIMQQEGAAEATESSAAVEEKGSAGGTRLSPVAAAAEEGIEADVAGKGSADDVLDTAPPRRRKAPGRRALDLKDLEGFDHTDDAFLSPGRIHTARDGRRVKVVSLDGNDLWLHVLTRMFCLGFGPASLR